MYHRILDMDLESLNDQEIKFEELTKASAERDRKEAEIQGELVEIQLQKVL